MQGTRILPTSLVALSLAIAVPAAATAQDAPALDPSSAYATGSIIGMPARWLDGTPEQTGEGQRRWHDRGIVAAAIEFSDPRLSGLLSFTAAGTEQQFSDGVALIESRSYRLTNDGGSWRGTGQSVYSEGPDGPQIDYESFVLEGEGPYEGLVAHVVMEGDGQDPMNAIVEAVVLETERAAAPEPVAATGPYDISSYQGPDELDPFLADWVGQADGGVAALLIRDGATTTGAVGVANEGGDPMTADTALRTGSVSQMFISAMVLQMVDEGRVDLDAPLSTYLPETKVGGDATVRELLSHRSGVAEYVGSPGFFDDLFADPERSYTPDEILGYVVEAPVGQPGEYAPSNTNFILLGQLVEAVDGVDLDAALQTRIAGPLGLTATTYDVSRAGITDRLAGVWGGPFQGQPWTEAIASSAWAAGGLISTANELATFLDALFAGEIVRGELLAEMLDTERDDQGLGIAEIDSTLDVGLFLGMNGGGLGYQSFVTGDPRNGDILVLMSNSDGIDTNWGAVQILGDWIAAGS